MKPSQSYTGEFTLQTPATGAATDADSTPTALAHKNGAVDAGFVLTVASTGTTGHYKVTGTVPAGYAAGDLVHVIVTAAVGGVTGRAVIEAFEIDTKRVSELNDPTAAGTATAVRSELAIELARLDETVGSRMATFGLPANFAALAINGSGHVVLQDGSLVTAKLGAFALAKGTNLTGFNDLSGVQVKAQADAALADIGATALRMGWLDNINVGGPVASSSEVTAIQNNTRVVRVVPSVLERPDSGSTAFRIELLVYDETGGMEAPDAAPTIAVVNQAGTSRDGNLDSTTMALVSTGRYRATYTIDTAHALEQLIFSFSVVEGGATRLYANPAMVVDTTAVDFTAADRLKLEQLASDYTTARAGKLDFLDAAVTSRMATFLVPANFASMAINGSGHVILQDGSLLTAKLGVFALAKGTHLTGFNDLSTTQVKTQADAALADAGYTALRAGKLDNLNATIDSRMPVFAYVAPDNANIVLAKAGVDKMVTTLEQNGAVWRFTGAALINTPASGSTGLTAQEVRDAMKLAASGGTAANGSIDAKLDALTLSSGSGAFAVTVTVTDGTAPLQNAAVRVLEGVTPYSARTDVNGQAVFALNAATYAVAVTKPGYQFTPATRTVTGEQAGTLTAPLVMAAVAAPAAPADAALCRVYGAFEKLNNLPAANLEVIIEMVSGAAVKSERVLSLRKLRLLTDADGRLMGEDNAPFVDLQRNDLLTPAGTSYRVTAKDSKLDKVAFTLTGPTFDLASLVT